MGVLDPEDVAMPHPSLSSTAPAEPQGTVIIPPLAVPPKAYEVRIRETLGDTLTLVGHDRRGDPMVELRIPRRVMQPGFTERVRRFCQENDGPDADLSIVP